MRDFQFEYTDQRFLWTLFGLMFGIFLGGLLIFVYLLKPFVSPFFIMLILIGVPILFFFLYKKRIKKNGIAKLSGNSVNINLSDNEMRIDFKDIEYYYYYKDRHNSTTFTLHLNDKSKFKITCHNYYCNPESFDNFFVYFKNNIATFNKDNNCNISQLKTIFSKRVVPFILIPLTIVLIPLLFFVPFPPKALIIGLTSGLIISWIKYITSRHKK